MLDLLYPRRCPVCAEISQGICEKCQEKIKVITHPRCYKCGKPVEGEETEYCEDCSGNHHYFTEGRGLLLYEGKVKESIHRIKYENKREYLDVYAQLMAEKLGNDVKRWNPQVCIPIPMYSGKKKLRGFNQAEILAQKLGELLDIPVDTEILQKIKDTGDQKALDVRQRKHNIQGAFAVTEDFLYQRVLLIDDVYTTGNTIDAAAKTLLDAGAREIYFLTICIGQGN
ncbi:MAG: double zinc ribbon domain-containing protein [Muricoprocola sp.]